MDKKLIGFILCFIAIMMFIHISARTAFDKQRSYEIQIEQLTKTIDSTKKQNDSLAKKFDSIITQTKLDKDTLRIIDTLYLRTRTAYENKYRQDRTFADTIVYCAVYGRFCERVDSLQIKN